MLCPTSCIHAVVPEGEGIIQLCSKRNLNLKKLSSSKIFEQGEFSLSLWERARVRAI
jgi:hypothetical protein